MPVVELATIYLQHSITTNHNDVKTILWKAKSVQEEASGFPAYYFQDMIDAKKLYIVGTWPSREAHMAFLPQKQNQEVLELLLPLCTKDNPFRLMHIDGQLKGTGDVGSVDWENMGVIMYGIEMRWKDKLEKNVLEEGKGLHFSGQYERCAGWSIEEEDEGKATFVLIKGTDEEPVLEGTLKDVSSQVSAGPGDYGIEHWSWFRAKRLSDL